MSRSRILILIAMGALLAGSCGHVLPGATSPGLPTFRYNHSMEAFEFSPDCPNGCFLGIKPNSTTAVEALHILQKSPDIDHSKIYILHADAMELEKNVNDTSLKLLDHGGTLEAPWVPTNNKEWGDYVRIGATDGIVDGLSAKPIVTTIQDFVSLIGEPDKIKVASYMPPDAAYIFSYRLYYSKWKVALFSLSGATIEGPKPSDTVDYVILNAQIAEADYRAWQGFGKMPQYMSPQQLQDYERFTGDHPTVEP